MASDQQKRWSLAFLVPAGVDHPDQGMRCTGSEAQEPSYQPDQHFPSSTAVLMMAHSAAQRSETTSLFDTVQRNDGWKMVEQPSTWPLGEWSGQADRIWTTLLLWGDTGRKAALPSLSGAGVARVGDAASEGLRFEQLQPRQLEPVGEQPTTAALHDGVDE